MNDLHLSFTHLLVHAEEIGYELEISETDGYILVNEDGTPTYCTTLGEVAVELGRVRLELLNYAEEWDRNLHRFRPV